MKKRFFYLLLSMGLLFGFSGCGNSSSSASSNTNDINDTNVSSISFLDGGTYGSLLAKIIPFDGDTILPYLGVLDSFGNSAKKSYNQNFITYGGALSTLGNTYELNGNTFMFEPVTLKYLVQPNASNNMLNRPISFMLLYYADGAIHCVQKNGSSLSIIKGDPNSYICKANPLVQNVVYTSGDSALEIKLNLGEFNTTKGMDFTLAALVDDELVSMTDVNGRQTSTYLTSNDKIPNVLPKNIVAHGNFLPNPDGFGFPNTGNDAHDTLTDNDIAMMYGSNSVCYSGGATDCKLNVYGFYLLDKSREQSGGQCYGYALASVMLKQSIPFKGKSKPTDYNKKANSAIALNFSDTQNLIAFKFLNQNTQQIQEYLSNTCSNLTPMDVIDKIKNGFKNGDPIGVLAFFKQGGGGGHAVTPYAITQESATEYRIYIYDNNYPSTQRFITVNSDKNSWLYYGGQNASDKSSLYDGYGTTNTLCPIPVSYQQYYAISNQTMNSFLLTNESASAKTQFLLTSPSGASSGWDFNSSSGGYINNIPNTNAIKMFDKPQSSYEISNISVLPTLNVITSFSQLQQYLNASYQLFAANNEDANLSRDVSASISTLNTSYSSGIISRQENNNTKESYLVHPSSRIFAAQNPNGLILTLYLDDNIKQNGYIYSIQINNTISGNVGALIADDGTLEVFVYGDDSFSQTAEYTVLGKLIDKNGVISSNSVKVKQSLNTAYQIKPDTLAKQAKGAQKSDTKSLSLSVSKVY